MDAAAMNRDDPEDRSAHVEDPEKITCLTPAPSEMTLAPIERANLFKDAVVKIVTVAYLHGGSNMLSETMNAVKDMIAAIKGMPASCEVEINNASSNAMQALKLLNTIGGAEVDTLALAQADKFVKDDRRSFAEQPNYMALTLQCTHGVTKIDKAVVKTASKAFGSNASRQQLARTLRGQRSGGHGRSLWGKCIVNIGTYNAKSAQFVAANFGEIEGFRSRPGDSVAMVSRGHWVCVGCILGNRGAWASIHGNADFDAAWKWVDCAPLWFKPTEILGPNCRWKSFRQFLDKVKVYFDLVKSHDEIRGESGVLKDHLAEAPAPAAGAFRGLLEQALKGKNANNGIEAELIDDARVEGFEAAAQELKTRIFLQISGADLQAPDEKSNDFTLSKIQGGPVDKMWSEGLAATASVEEEVGRKFRQLEALTATEQRFDMTLPAEKKPGAMTLICNRAAQTLCEYEALGGIKEVGNNVVAAKIFMMTVVANTQEWKVTTLIEPFVDGTPV
ncbi:unnamed protein product [Prorocentrum cordatum]|uniref:Uncharacterized protein n=1 Tax=Prorocentrum cordatum TaxID=2364126 RepID=A0ABN9U9N2_9DINO|nr:unnamed protein product [Polarella glacialis]